MTFNKNKIHLVPQLIVDRAGVMMIDSVNPQLKETYADQLETVRDFCIKSLNEYEKTKKTKRRA